MWGLYIAVPVERGGVAHKSQARADESRERLAVLLGDPAQKSLLYDLSDIAVLVIRNDPECPNDIYVKRDAALVEEPTCVA